MSSPPAAQSSSFPWYIKAIILLAILVVLYVIGVDLLTFLSQV